MPIFRSYLEERVGSIVRTHNGPDGSPYWPNMGDEGEGPDRSARRYPSWKTNGVIHLDVEGLRSTASPPHNLKATPYFALSYWSDGSGRGRARSSSPPLSLSAPRRPATSLSSMASGCSSLPLPLAYRRRSATDAGLSWGRALTPVQGYVLSYPLVVNPASAHRGKFPALSLPSGSMHWPVWLNCFLWCL